MQLFVLWDSKSWLGWKGQVHHKSKTLMFPRKECSNNRVGLYLIITQLYPNAHYKTNQYWAKFSLYLYWKWLIFVFINSRENSFLKQNLQSTQITNNFLGVHIFTFAISVWISALNVIKPKVYFRINVCASTFNHLYTCLCTAWFFSSPKYNWFLCVYYGMRTAHMENFLYQHNIYVLYACSQIFLTCKLCTFSSRMRLEFFCTNY